jgi:hypothetical protein
MTESDVSTTLSSSPAASSPRIATQRIGTSVSAVLIDGSPAKTRTRGEPPGCVYRVAT